MTADAHCGAVGALAVSDDWAGLVRYWAGHGFHEPALREAARVARTGGTPEHVMLAEYLDAVRKSPAVPAPFPVRLPPLSECERITLELLLSLPRILFCETAVSAPIEERDAYFRMGLEVARDASALFEEAPLRATLFDLQARAHEHLGETEAAAERLAATVAIRRDLARADPACYGTDLGRTLDRLGQLLDDAGRGEEALACLEEAAHTYEQSATTGVDTRPARAFTLQRLGILLSELGIGVEAVERFSESVAIRRQLAAANPRANGVLARGLYTLGAVLTECRRLGEAEACLREAVTLLRGGGPIDDLGAALTNLGDLFAESNRWSEAQAALVAATEVLRETDDESGLATALARLGAVLTRTGRHEEAAEHLERAIALRRLLASKSPRVFEPKLANALNSLGNVRCDQRDWARAMAAYEEAAALLAPREAESPAHEAIAAMVVNNLGTARLERGDAVGALEVLNGAVARYGRLADAAPEVYAPDLAMSLGNRANALRKAGRHAEALADYDAAAARYRSVPNDLAQAVEPDLALLLANRGAVLRDLNRLTEARGDYESVVRCCAGLSAREPAAYEPDLARNLSNLGVILTALGEHGAAVDRFGSAVAIWGRCSARSPAVHEAAVADTWANLAIPLRNLGRLAEALAAVDQAANRYRLMSGEAGLADDLARVLNNRGVVLASLGEHEAAVLSFRESLSARGAASHGAPALLAGKVGTWNNLGAAYSAAGDTAAALACHRDALDLARRLVASFGEAYAPDLATSLTNLGGFAWSVGRHADAIEALREAVGLYRDLSAREPAAHGRSLGAALINLGGALADAGSATAAIGAYESALSAIGEGPDAMSDRATAHLNFGNLLRRLGDLPAAERQLATAARLFGQPGAVERGGAYAPADEALALNNLGVVAQRRGETDSARSYYREAIERLESAHHAEVLHPAELATCWANLGDLEAECQWSAAPAARDAHRRAVGYAEAARGLPRADLRRKRDLLTEYRDVYDRLAEAALAAWEAGGDEADGVAAAEAAELGRARTLAELLAREFLPPNAGNELAESVHRAWLRRRLAALAALTASEPGAPAGISVAATGR